MKILNSEFKLSSTNIDSDIMLQYIARSMNIMNDFFL